MIYFTSDLHFHHNKIREYSPVFRNYPDSESMQEALIEVWNQRVGAEDIVYDLGDFSMASSLTRIIKTAKRLNGKHYLILGNHDELIRTHKEELLSMSKDDDNLLFEEIVDYKTFKAQDKQFVLSHYPMFGWENQQHGSIMLHGHLHDHMTDLKGRILNVGYDLHGKIVSIDEVLKYLKDIPQTNYRFNDKEEINRYDTVEKRKEMIKNKLASINAF